MTALIVGLVLLLGSHSIRVAAPTLRSAMVARMGDGPYKGFSALVSLVGLVLIVWGFGHAWEDPIFLYTLPSWGRHVTIALMIPALILAFAAAFPARWTRHYVAHPLLTATDDLGRCPSLRQ